MRRLSVFVLLAAAAGAQTTPTFDQSLAWKTASAPQISPDGSRVAYQVRKANWDDNEFQTEIWLADAERHTRRFTGGKKSSYGPRWSPDGKRIAFLSDRDEKPQIYVVRADGGEALALTSSETGVGAFRWAPDGKSIAYTAADPETKERKDRKSKYGEFEVVQGDYTMSHLWRIAVPEDDAAERPRPERLTQGSDFTVGDFDWAPDSNAIAFSGSRNPDLGMMHTSDIYVLRLSDRYLRKLVDTPGPDISPVWSPDGKQIAFRTADGQEFFYYKNSRIAVAPAQGGKPRVLTAAFDEDPFVLKWGPEGIYFSAFAHSYLHLYRVDPGSLAIARVDPNDRFSVMGGSFSADCTRMAFSGAGDNAFPEIYVSSLKPYEPQRLTSMSDQLKPFRLAQRELIQWKSTDGTPIEGVLIKPADYDASRQYPLLVVIHGGPTGVDGTVLRPEYAYPVEAFAAKGALILQPNYRGSAGYGEKFRSLNVRNLGVGDYEDVISGVDYLIGKGMVDRDRVGAMGWSQGGYISAFITCFSDRFKAVSAGAGISDWTTYYVNTDIHPFTRQYLKATPWEDPEIYRKTSPISYVKNARTPTLIQHGELDKRVPIPNSYELRQALEDRGVPVKMVVYKGFGHGINKPKQQRSLMEDNYEWFSRWVWGEKPITEPRP